MAQSIIPFPKREFHTFNISSLETALRTKPEAWWNKRGATYALNLFQEASFRVPAYKTFLKKHGVKPETIKTIEDFKRLPITTKENYVSRFSIAQRSWDGKLEKHKIIATSSGTKGEPTFWPRSDYQEFEQAVTHELLYRRLEIQTYKTLVIIGFPMGVYVSGMATAIPSLLVAAKGYDLSVVTAGNNKAEILRVVANLQSSYEQIILIGHPFFLKDVIESGKKQKIKWNTTKLRLIFCSEGFSEEWRNYLVREAGISHPEKNTISTYGSSELLLMAYETSFTIKLRQKLEKNKKLLQSFLPKTTIVPSIFQYNPLLRYIESHNGELLFTARSGLPLIRFNLHDSGTVLSREAANRILGGKSEISDWQLPLVTLNGRSDNTMIFYAANIYPEHIHAALHQKQFLRLLTGKFTMRKDYLKNLDEFLEINIELKSEITPSQTLEIDIQNAIVEKLRAINMEYLFLCNNLDKDLTPRIKLRTYQDPVYFKPGLKPKYIA